MLQTIILFGLMIQKFQVNSQGLNVTFGQNRIQHKTHKWKTISANDITVMYYQENAVAMANYVIAQAIKELPKIQLTMGYNLNQGIHLILYNSHYDYNHSNLELIDPKFYSGGLTIIPKNQAAIYFNGDRQNLTSQIKAGISRVIFNELIFGGSISERIRSSSTVSLPSWYSEGLAHYIGYGWDTEKDNDFRDILKTNKLSNYSNLIGEDAIFNGSIFWKFCVDKYGEDIIATMLFNTKYSRSVDNTVYYISGLKTSTFIKSLKFFYEESYKKDLKNTNLPSNFSEVNSKINKLKHTNLKVSPNGQNILSVVNSQGKYKLILHNIKKNTTKTIYKGGRRILNQLPDYSLPVVAFKNDKSICIADYKKGKMVLKFLDFNGKVLSITKLKDIQHIKEIDFYDDLTLLTAVKNSQTDLFLFEFNDPKNITNTIEDENDASFSSDGNNIVFTEQSLDSLSNKISFIKSIVTEPREGQNIRKAYIWLQSNKESFKQAKLLKHNNLVYLSNKNGIYNQYLKKYRFKGAPQTLTNYSSSILLQDLSDNGHFLTEMLLIDGKYKIFNYDLGRDGLLEPIKDSLISTYYFASKTKVTTDFNDSIEQTQNEVKSNYIYYSGFDSTDIEVWEEDLSKKYIFTKYYEEHTPRFSLDYAISGFNNSHLLSYYYLMDARGQFSDPLFTNVLFQASLSDRLKNYSLNAGVRIPFSADGAEVFLKGGYYAKRIDHKFATFRRSIFIDNEFDYKKYITSQISYSPSYAISENLRFETDFSYRSDVLNPLGFTEDKLLEKPQKESLLGFDLNIVFDNTISTGRNSMLGFRLKTGVENKQGLNKKRNLSTFFIDARWYKKIYSKINFATRFASGYSLGTDQTIFYMGGVENWISSKYEDNTDLSLTDNHYLFRSDVANLRGFKKGIRVGSHYLISNNEIRIPYYGLIKKTPSHSEFIKNLSAVVFMDIGTAWTEKSPYDAGNPHNTEYIFTPSLDIEIIANRSPFVYTYGLGVRSKLLGYFIKYDLGWGVSDNEVGGPVGYFSLGFDF